VLSSGKSVKEVEKNPKSRGVIAYQIKYILPVNQFKKIIFDEENASFKLEF
jgi:hypothetical protein